MSSNPAALNIHASKAGARGVYGLTFLFGSLACEFVTRAQTVLPPPPSISVTPPALQEFRASQLGESHALEESSGFSLGTLPFQWGPVNVRPHVLGSYLYSDGILSSPGQPQSTVSYQFSPGLAFTFGSHWALDYTPSWSWYSDRNFHSSLGQSLSLNGWTSYEDWILGLVQGVNITSAPLVQTGTQTDQESYTTSLSASHRLNSKVSIDFSLSQDFEFADQFSSYRQWSTMEWVNYQFWPRLDGGLGLGGGYVNVSTGSDMTFEQLQGRISWRAADRTSLTVHGGLEDRQFLSGGVPPLLNPLYGVAIQYRAGRKTSVSLTVDHAVSASYFQSQAAETTSVGLNIGQSLSEKLSLSLGVGLTSVSYAASAPGVAAGGSYDYKSVNVRLGYSISKRCSLSGTYTFSDNASSQTQAGLGFSSNQIGIELGYGF